MVEIGQNIEYKPFYSAEMGSSAIDSMQKNMILEVVRDTLFEKQKIAMITSLTRSEICLITAIKEVEDHQTAFLDNYMQLLLSERRKSREEVIDAIKGMTGSKKNLFKRLGDAIRGNEGE